MKKTITYLIIVVPGICLLLSFSRFSDSARGFVYPDTDYPSGTAKLFSPNFISTRYHEHSMISFNVAENSIAWYVVFTPGQRNFAPKGSNLQVVYQSGKWTDPSFVKFLDNRTDFEGSYSPDGKNFYFGSTRSESGGEYKPDSDIWCVSKNENKWSPPARLGNNINTPKYEQQPTVSAHGNLYFVGYLENGANGYGIFKSAYNNGKFRKTELLPEVINSEYVDWTPFIDPEERFLLFSSTRPGGYGQGDIYISYRLPGNKWSRAENLGPKVNTNSNERFPSISPDGKFLFFTRDSCIHKTPEFYAKIDSLLNFPGNGYNDVYWISTGALTSLR